MSLLQIAILAFVQGIAELLPVSSSAHVVLAEKAMGLDPTSPQMTLLLVMLHTGTMFAVLLHYWPVWRETYFSSIGAFRRQAWNVVLATIATGVVGLALMAVLKRIAGHGDPNFQVEQLFGNTTLIATALAGAGILILVSSLFERSGTREINGRRALVIGAVQGLCLPFRGFSRSGATISTGLLQGVLRQRAEQFSFALAVVLTPPVVVREIMRLAKGAPEAFAGGWVHAFMPGLLGMVLSFAAGLLALKWLASWLESGRWYLFGIYCLVASGLVFWLA